jgi:hypothetical protein
VFRVSTEIQNVDGRGLRKSLHCSCGHTVALHAPRGCGGVTMRSEPCPCELSDAATLDAAVRSFAGSRARLRRQALRLIAPLSVRRAARCTR